MIVPRSNQFNLCRIAWFIIITACTFTTFKSVRKCWSDSDWKFKKLSKVVSVILSWSIICHLIFLLNQTKTSMKKYILQFKIMALISPKRVCQLISSTLSWLFRLFSICFHCSMGICVKTAQLNLTIAVWCCTVLQSCLLLIFFIWWLCNKHFAKPL